MCCACAGGGTGGGVGEGLLQWSSSLWPAFPKHDEKLLLEAFLHKTSAPCHLALSFLPRVTHLSSSWLRVSHAVAGGGREGAFMVLWDPGWSLVRQTQISGLI